MFMLSRRSKCARSLALASNGVVVVFVVDVASSNLIAFLASIVSNTRALKPNATATPLYKPEQFARRPTEKATNLSNRTKSEIYTTKMTTATTATTTTTPSIQFEIK